MGTGMSCSHNTKSGVVLSMHVMRSLSLGLNHGDLQCLSQPLSTHALEAHK